MSKKPSDKKISQIKSTRESSSVEKAESVGTVGSVGEVKATSAVKGVKGTTSISGKRRVGASITREQRAQLLAMIGEEADRMFNEGSLPASQKDVVKNAVLMAVDAALVLQEDEAEAQKEKK